MPIFRRMRHRKHKPRIGCDAGLPYGLPDSDLLSHRLRHYHRRTGVSRSCSGWEGVGPPCSCRQALNFQGKDSSPHNPVTKLASCLHCIVFSGSALHGPPGPWGQAARAISNGQLNVSPRFHTRPINVLVSDGPSGRSKPPGSLISRRVSRLDAFSGYPFRT